MIDVNLVDCERTWKKWTTVSFVGRDLCLWDHPMKGKRKPDWENMIIDLIFHGGAALTDNTYTLLVFKINFNLIRGCCDCTINRFNADLIDLFFRHFHCSVLRTFFIEKQSLWKAKRIFPTDSLKNILCVRCEFLKRRIFTDLILRKEKLFSCHEGIFFHNNKLKSFLSTSLCFRFFQAIASITVSHKIYSTLSFIRFLLQTTAWLRSNDFTETLL